MIGPVQAGPQCSGSRQHLRLVISLQRASICSRLSRWWGQTAGTQKQLRISDLQQLSPRSRCPRHFCNGGDFMRLISSQVHATRRACRPAELPGLQPRELPGRHELPGKLPWRCSGNGRWPESGNHNPGLILRAERRSMQRADRVTFRVTLAVNQARSQYPCEL